ncbi:MAG: flagellar motor switch protein FliM [Oscillospiraceae bacterium]
MSEILSQSEIDSLINEIAMGDKKASAGDLASESNIKPYDFKTANRFPKEQMRTINIVMQSFAQLLANFFTGALRSYCELEILSIEELTFYEFNNALPNPVLLAIINSEPMEGSILMQLSAEITDAIINRLFGGASSNMISRKTFTEIELAIIERIINQMLRFFDEAWARVVRTRSRLDRIETSSQFAQIVDINEPVAVITFNMKIGPDAGVISICLPHVAIEPVAKQMNTRSWYSKQGKKTGVNSEGMGKKIYNTMVELHAIFNDTTASVKDIAYLQVGDVIQLEHRIDEPLTIKIQNLAKFRAAFGTKGLKYAVRITDIIKGEDDK